MFRRHLAFYAARPITDRGRGSEHTYAGTLAKSFWYIRRAFWWHFICFARMSTYLLTLRFLSHRWPVTRRYCSAPHGMVSAEQARGNGKKDVHNATERARSGQDKIVRLLAAKTMVESFIHAADGVGDAESVHLPFGTGSATMADTPLSQSPNLPGFCHSDDMHQTLAATPLDFDDWDVRRYSFSRSCLSSALRIADDHIAALAGARIVFGASLASRKA